MVMQMLPLAQIGQALGQNYWTEELPHHDGGGKIDGNSHLNHPFLPPPEFTVSNTSYEDSKASAYIHFSEQIPSNHSTEIVSPPPDSII